MVSMGDDLCRVDTRDGSILRSSAGVFADPERFWVRPSSGEVVVLHYPNPDESMELLTLDGTTLTPSGSTELSFEESVVAIGRTTWISRDRSSRLEPGALPVPYLSPIRSSSAGSYFVYSNGTDDYVFLSAVDGSEVGTMPAGMNLSQYSDWSIDDSWFVRLNLERTVEVYRF
jgi:hypothetical protein